MLVLGQYQKLVVVDKTDFGLYLAENAAAEEKVLLPRRYIPGDTGMGKTIEVFLYKDSEDRPIATTEKPFLTMGQVRLLQVREVSRLGAFLDWGLPKDLFLPFKEMTAKVHEGDEVLVRLYVDKSSRLAASMKKLYPLLSRKSPYEAGDEVEGRIYEFGHDFGTFVAVDDQYSAMVPRHEDLSAHHIGEVIGLRVTGVKPDGKLDVTTRKEKQDQMDEDAKKVLGIIDSYAGVLPFTEKADAQVIFRETGLSKNAFKRAVGRLYKERKVVIADGRIRKA